MPQLLRMHSPPDDLFQRREFADFRGDSFKLSQLAARQPEAGVPATLHGKPEATVLFNNLASIPATRFQYPTDDEDKAALGLKIDQAVRDHAPAGWRGDQAREAQVLNVLYPLLDRDREATQALFDIIKNQPGY